MVKEAALNNRLWTFLIAGLWLSVSASALAGHQVPRVDYAAERFAREADQWRATTHYADGRSQRAWLAAAMSQASRELNEQLHYRRPFGQVWASWEVLAARYFEARELKSQLAYRHGANIVRSAAFPQAYNMNYSQGHDSARYRTGSGSAHRTSYEVVQNSWHRMADAFYELHEAIRLERDRYYASYRGRRYSPTYGSRSGLVKSGYYRR